MSELARGKTKLIRDISANTLQTGIVQLFGLIIFYITSKYLSKQDFGELNWAMAIVSTIIAIASLGLDLVFVKRIASGHHVFLISGIHFLHTLIVAFFSIIAALTIRFFFPSFTALHPLFFIVFINLALSNIANSFKLCLNGLESYRQLAILALLVNVIKLGLVMLLYVSGNFTVFNVVLSYIVTSLAELLIGYYLLGKNAGGLIVPVLKIDEYKRFIKESLPQLGVVVFDSALARIDWILLGILSTTVATADYSFTYKIFELSKFPLLIVAPVLLTRFSKLFVVPEEIDDKNRNDIQTFFKLEMFLLMFIPIVLICIWTPLIDYFTDNKYGLVNEVNYWILAPCVPLVCIINFLWTLGFVQGQLKTIMFITITVSVLNIISNAVLIPFYGQTGASVSYLGSTLVQLLLYLLYIKQNRIKLDIKSGFLAIVGAVLAIVAAKQLTDNVILSSILAVTFYIVMAFATNQINIKQLKQVMSRGHN